MIVCAAPAFEDRENLTLHEISIGKNHKWRDKQIKELDQNAGLLIIMVKRGDNILIPNGDTRICRDDVLVLRRQSGMRTRLSLHGIRMEAVAARTPSLFRWKDVLKHNLYAQSRKGSAFFLSPQSVIPVLPISGKGASQMGHLYAYLMVPPCVQFYFYERCAVVQWTDSRISL